MRVANSADVSIVDVATVSANVATLMGPRSMPPANLHRTLTFRTAVSASDFGADNGGPGSLALLLDQIHEHRTTVRERSTRFEGQVVELRNMQIDNDGVHLYHLVAYTPDDRISIVPNTPARQIATLRLLDPPENAEFLDGDMMVLVKDNDVILCRNGLSEKALTSYVYNLGRELNFESQDVSFILYKRADVDQLQMVRRNGINSIRFDGVASQVAAERAERQSARRRFISPIYRELQAIFGAETENDGEDDDENLKVEVLLSFSKRSGTILDQRQLRELAEQIINDEEEEGFVIELNGGQKIRPNDILLSKSVRIPPYGKSVSLNQAWAELRQFYEELRQIPQNE
ncbi:MAG: hypothetical protein RID91_13140 [Azospirillaceae bacterium]